VILHYTIESKSESKELWREVYSEKDATEFIKLVEWNFKPYKIKNPELLDDNKIFIKKIE
jgi:hypothetical protein